ncbi:MAG: histidine kinase dimerization/phosphoacceptor domain -containing protein [Nitrospirota bacterium]
MIDTALKASKGTSQIGTEDYTKAILNILEDFSEEKARLEKTQRAILNIIEDSSVEKMNLEGTQSAVINILEDFTGEKGRLEETERAVLNVLEDFSAEKSGLEGTQSAMLNLLDDFDRERVKTEAARRELQQSNAQLRKEMEERSKVEEQVKKSLGEKEALLKEIHHRVKNNLQIIQSMLNLQLPQIKDEKAIALFKESQDRVYSMALIHEKLYQSESLAKIDFLEYIRSLTNYLFLSYGATGRAIRSKILVKDISLDVDTTIPCALIINELVSNSLKHAFPASRRSEEPGEICISLRLDVDNRFLLSVSDNGVGLPAGFEIQNSDSLGLKLVVALVKQLNGNIHIGGNAGAEFMISFTAKNEKED